MLCAIAMLVIVLWLRAVEYDAEADGYHIQAEQLLQGNPTVDRFHPFGYSLLVACVLFFVGNSLVAGGIVSAVAAAFLVWATGRIAATLRPEAWLFGQLFAVANAHVWVLGSMACSDMTAAALLSVATALVATSSQTIGWRRTLAIGVLLGFGAATRFSALTPALAVGGWLCWRGRSPRVVAVLLLGLVVGFAPQGALSTALTGSPLQGQNWHNLYFKVVCEYDLERLQHAYDTDAMPTAAEFVREHGGEVLRQAARDFVHATVDVLPGLMLGRRHAPGIGLLWPLLLAVAGLIAWRRHRPAGGWLLAIALVHVLTVCLFWPRARLFFSVLPLLLAGVAVAVAALPRPWLRAAAGLLFAVLCVVVGRAEFTRYLANQPTAELALARQLPTLVPRQFGVLTTWSLLGRYTSAKVWLHLPSPPDTSEQAWLDVAQGMDEVGADLFLTGRASQARLHRLLTATPPPERMRVLFDDGEALLIERMLAPSTWIATCERTPTDGITVGDRITWRLTLGPDADRGQIFGGGCALRGPDGKEALIQLTPAADGAFEGGFVATAVGDWDFTPFLLCTGDRVERAAPGRFTVAPR